MVDGASAGNVQPEVVALVPMRHESERVPNKNFRPLAGKPLYAHILDTLQACAQVAQIVVDTDSPIIREGIEAGFPEIVLLKRPEHLLGGHVPMNEVLLYDVTQVPAQFYLQTHSTNPLLKAATITSAIASFFAEYPEHDSLFSVTPLRARIWNAKGKPINHDPTVLLNTQDLPPVFLENSCIYVFEREGFLRSRNRIGKRPLMFEISADQGFDIDTDVDFGIAEHLVNTT